MVWCTRHHNRPLRLSSGNPLFLRGISKTQGKAKLEDDDGVSSGRTYLIIKPHEPVIGGTALRPTLVVH